MSFTFEDYAVTLKGQTPILFHADDVEAADHLSAWRKDPRNKNFSVPGDDRSPPWTWQMYVYHDGTNLALPQENIMAGLGKAGAMIPMKKGKASFKAVSQSGLMSPSEHWEFRSRGKPVTLASIHALRDLKFSEQAEGAKKLGFDLLVKRASVDRKKHVRVRARFRDWSASGVIRVIDPIIDAETLAELFFIFGAKIGLLDWRPGSPVKPGPYGTFKAEVKPLEARKSA